MTIKTLWQAWRGRSKTVAPAPSTFMSTEAPILQGKTLTQPGVYWYFGPHQELPALVDVLEREGRLRVVFKDGGGVHDAAALGGYFDGPIPGLPPPSTIAGGL